VERMEEISPQHRPEIGAILPLRRRYDTFANFRPVRLPRELAHFSPLKPEYIGAGIDILMIRELVGGIYFGDKVEGPATGMRYATDECTYSEAQVRRIAVVGFDEARKRRTRLTSIDKANVLATSRFWKKIVEEVAADYPDVPYQSMLVDNAAYQLVKNPTALNGVMLLENMQGDILTDQAGGIIGSLGLMPSACIGPQKGYVEPAHGSAPDIAGKGIANPYSMIGSVALMFERCLGLPQEAALLWQALFKVFASGYTTGDLVVPGTTEQRILSTAEFGDLVVRHIELA
ncbi:MAG TPA: isocitrate/isopropylmalate family dehydrogenase, partial [Deltaproteobacteria bacterium]|nr:isocitrate/isopropylmalate family dehydrogenase [Deltaproteobacteria bacterium]